ISILSSLSLHDALPIFLTLIICGTYVRTVHELSLSRKARQSDDYVAAEQHLAACWPLPGLRSAIALENDLAGIQQGDLTEEAARSEEHTSELQSLRHLV